MTSNFKVPRIRNKPHLKFVASLPCVGCGIRGYSQSAHIKRAGMALKEGDNKTLPMCCQRYGINGCHADSEKREIEFFDPYGGYDKADKLCDDLYENTGNESKCLELIRNFRCGMYL